MPETEPKITVQVTQHLWRHRGIQNPAKNLKWSKKERLAKTNYNLELLRHYKIFDRVAVTVELLNIPGS